MSIIFAETMPTLDDLEDTKTVNARRRHDDAAEAVTDAGHRAVMVFAAIVLPLVLLAVCMGAI